MRAVKVERKWEKRIKECDEEGASIAEAESAYQNNQT
jgi:hypothetical protein